MCLSDDGTCSDGRESNELPALDGGHSSLERILIGLQDHHRRYLLYHLQEEDPCQLDEAARHVVALDQECDPEDVSTEIHDRIKAELYHTHLPKLADLKIIEYDQRSGAIRLRDTPDKLDEFLSLARDIDVESK